LSAAASNIEVQATQPYSCDRERAFHMIVNIHVALGRFDVKALRESYIW